MSGGLEAEDLLVLDYHSKLIPGPLHSSFPLVGQNLIPRINFS